jgi:phosphohistidine phosphatase
MLTLSLLRHAKSSWADPELDDHDRPLAKRGVKAMPEIAKYLRREQLRPSLVLCSSAVRTRATVALLLAGLGPPAPELVSDDALYLAQPSTLLAVLRETSPSHPHVMLVGHNPGLHALALELVGDGDRKLVGALAMEFPTAALAVLTFPLTQWTDVRAASGRLDHFATPRSLAEHR